MKLKLKRKRKKIIIPTVKKKKKKKKKPLEFFCEKNNFLTSATLYIATGNKWDRGER